MLFHIITCGSAQVESVFTSDRLQEEMCSDSLMWTVHSYTVASVMLMNDSWLLHFLDASVIFRRVCKIVQMTTGFIMSVHPSLCLYGTTWLPLDGFSSNLWVFSKNVKRKFKFHYNRTRIINSYFVWRPIYIV
jgi:hypothetical protein